MALLNDNTLNPEQMKFVEAAIKEFGETVRRNDLKAFAEKTTGKKWAPSFIVKNEAAKTKERGVYKLTAFKGAPAAPATPKAARKVAGKSKSAAKASTNVPTNPATGKPLSMTPDAIRKRKARLLAAQKKASGKSSGKQATA